MDIPAHPAGLDRDFGWLRTRRSVASFPKPLIVRLFALILLLIPKMLFTAEEPGMVALPGGEFLMGSDAPFSLPNERPAHRVRVSPFLLDTHPVTNADFARIVAATGYITVAERPVDWEELKKQAPPGTPKPPAELLPPGSMVFRPTPGPVDLRNMAQWWQWVPGANWRNPEGPGSGMEGKENARYPWGDEERPEGRWMANRWTGNFPYQNTAEDGFVGVASVGSFPPNAFGLYDMAGNMGNWCADIYYGAVYAQRASDGTCCDPTSLLAEEPELPLPGDPSPVEIPGPLRRVSKGGSYLCAPDYCKSYRPLARRGMTPDSSTNHLGFRCAKSLPSVP